MNHGRLFILTQLFDPEPTFKGLKFASALQQSGFDVEVVTGFPNYPGGKIYDGYRIRPLTREILSGVRITRLAMYPDHGRNPVRRILSYVSFMLSSMIYLIAVARRGDIVYVFYPSLTAGFAALAAKIVHRVPIVLDIQDMWPDSLSATGMIRNQRFLQFISLLCRFLYRNSDRLVVLSSGFRDLLISRGVPQGKISVIYNWAEETVPEPETKTPSGFDPSDEFRVLFAGNMGAAQGLGTILEAAAIVEGQRPGITFYFLGSGMEAEALQAKANAHHPNVRFLARVPLEQVQQYLGMADCLLVHLKSDDLFSITIPSKTQAYLFAARPILMAVHGEAADIVEQAGAGLVAQPETPSDIADKIMRLCDLGGDRLQSMGRSGRSFYDAHMSFSQGVAAFRTLLEEIESGSKPVANPGSEAPT